MINAGPELPGRTVTDSPASRDSASDATGRRVSVVQLIHTIAYGGIETIVLNWLLHLDPRQFEVHLVCFANPDHSEQAFVSAATRRGLSVATIPWHRGKPVFRAARELSTLASAWRPDILHCHNVYANLVGLQAARSLDVKTVASVYVWGNFGWKRNLLQKIDAWTLRRFDHVTSQCERTQQDTLGRGVRPERSSVLESGLTVTPRRMTPAERRSERLDLGASDEHVVLLNVARLHPEKAHDLLLRSFVEILRNSPQARLWIAGVGPCESDLKRLCSELGLDNCVRWLGFVDDLPPLFELADIQVHPSLNEGVPLALLHGMAAGMPIVATAVGGIPEVIEDGSNGVLVPGGDGAAFVRAVGALIQSPDEARRLGTAACDFIDGRYNLGQSVARLEQIYRQLLV